VFGSTLPYPANQPITVYTERLKVGQVPPLPSRFLPLRPVHFRVVASAAHRIAQDDTIHTRPACVLKSLCTYLNQDHEKLVKEYMDWADPSPNSELQAPPTPPLFNLYSCSMEEPAALPRPRTHEPTGKLK
ncbi:hypothetical protein INR49_032984, partial [Caranx melampygus]